MQTERSREHREKAAVALSSVVAGFVLMVLKGAGAWYSGSLGILAETAHSGLDLGAAALTYFAVRAAARPPDEDHNYGHQRMENISALAETVLLLATCAWILTEALRRLFFQEVHVSTGWFPFAVMGFSIIVDFSRSRALKRVAERYKSQALAADALHFTTDMASSAVVIVGLALVALGQALGWESVFHKADAISALAVAAIVVVLSLRLGREAIDVLVDRAPEGLQDEVRQVAASVPGVEGCRRVRVRRSGGDLFADVVIVTHGALSVEEAHRTADSVEDEVRGRFPHADIVVHVEPASSWPDPASTVRGLAARRGFTIHDLAVHRGATQSAVDMHVEVPAGLLLEDAHRLVAPLETDIRRELPGVETINVHLDPVDNEMVGAHDDSGAREEIQAFLGTALAGIPEVREFHDLQVRRSGRRLYVSVHVMFDGLTPLESVHRAAESLEARLRRRFPEILRVLVHSEPRPRGGNGAV